jgi:hypothetical protein
MARRTETKINQKLSNEVKTEHKHEFKNRKEKIAWYLDEIDSYKEDMGMWYTVFIRRILPFILYIMPIAVLVQHSYPSMVARFFSGILKQDDIYLPWAIYAISLVLYLAVLILLPRFATFCELVMGFMYIYMAFRFHHINTALGYFTIISVTLFVIMKLVFLVFEIMYMIIFKDEKQPKSFIQDDDFVV